MKIEQRSSLTNRTKNIALNKEENKLNETKQSKRKQKRMSETKQVN